MEKKLNKEILSTIIYYDLLDYPLTSFEIWRYLLAVNNNQETVNNERVNLSDVIKGLEDEDVKKYVEEYQGYYFLKGREKLVGQRLERNKISEKKFKKIFSIAKWLRFVPFVRMIAVTGTVAMKNAEKKSDLDLLVVLEHKRIFIGRTLVTLLVHLLGKRRYGRKITDRVCLNYFITTGSLGIELKDVFSASEYAFARPVFGKKTFEEFQKANGWIKNFMPNYEINEADGLKIAENFWVVRAVRGLGETILGFDFLENWLKGWQTERIVRDPRTHRDGSIIMADENSLVFLPEPRSPEIGRRFGERMAKI
ncbi:MAG: hypothetical protein QG620_945 [Patescibacteria group bacterium]|nr:hypothetical protein [Patescibacteria group bacterium]